MDQESEGGIWFFLDGHGTVLGTGLLFSSPPKLREIKKNFIKKIRLPTLKPEKGS